ncbi:hypothetical protein, partial [uncultured Mucilaginibacter sp.]|uniref:hypothetical protein n=1 Tax=uncultured Mucilaginibacter sp. TaxID=797541 RepID=UPI0025F89CD1
MSIINFQNARQAEGIAEELSHIRMKLEQRINLNKYSPRQKPLILANNKIMRICLLAGLSLSEKRDLVSVDQVQLSKTGNRIFDTLFTLHNLTLIYSAMLKLRYKDLQVDWENQALKSKIINAEILRGATYLANNNALEDYLATAGNSGARSGASAGIPFLNLNIGNYEDDIP